MWGPGVGLSSRAALSFYSCCVLHLFPKLSTVTLTTDDFFSLVFGFFGDILLPCGTAGVVVGFWMKLRVAQRPNGSCDLLRVVRL